MTVVAFYSMRSTDQETRSDLAYELNKVEAELFSVESLATSNAEELIRRNQKMDRGKQ